MSADYWRVCPKCKKGASESFNKEIEEVKKLYGTIGVDEYEAKINEIKGRKVKEILEHADDDNGNFREDYEFYMDGDDLVVSYLGQCTKCDFKVPFCRRVNIWTAEKAQEYYEMENRDV